MIESPQIVESESQIAVVINLEIPRDEIQNEMKPAIDELVSVLSEQGQSPKGHMFAHHLTQSKDQFNFEVGFPIDSPIRPVGRVKNGELPAATVARTTYQGPYEGLYSAWNKFGKILENQGVLEKNGLKPGKTLWEVYVFGPESTKDPTTWRTELNLPLVPVVS